MHLALIIKILGMLLMVFSITMLPPVLVAWIYDDGMELPFLSAFAITFASGMALWMMFFRVREELGVRDGFLIVTLFWTVLGLIGSLPFILILKVSPTDAIFESMSGLTTTGASVLSGLDDMAPSLLYYRQQLQWLGGMGVVVLAVAILPMLGVGGMQLYKAEIPGPMKESKLTPRIAETAKALWYVYLTVTIACATGYWLAGMSIFEAICHSFSTVSTGGFSTRDASMAAFDSAAVDWVGAFFMFFSGASFALMFAALRRGSIKTFFRDPEFRFYTGLMFIYLTIATVTLWAGGRYDSFEETARHAAFQVASYGTGTGLSSTDAAGNWPLTLLILLIFTSFISGCAGSTTAGMKVVRVALMLHQSQRELRRLVYPHGVFSLRFGRRTVNDQVLQSVWGFIGVFVTIAVLLTLAMMATGMDLVTAFSAVAASLNTLGMGIGGVSAGFGDIATEAKWLMCVAMLLGRLEVFTILVLFTPMFWRQ
ncbi:TrkH family potassium uptake protein [Alcanivorax sp. 1008]|uniref:TrkH family potassium uptake protein n=1 Tax=Alcanivorax sp. 1008 TaxID=2816853 RepID=UPI001E1105B2|nr:TrkH family potassium uptake protein [Alcanivorax sp. 1008]MCC1496235.1 potassium transporter [Alcanivorax sp. 1008]